MPVLTDTGIELITSKFIEADTDSTGSVNAEQLLIIFRPFFDSIGLDPPNEERIANRLASMQTETPGELTLTELLILMAYLKIMRICEMIFVAADINESGGLDRDEIKYVFRKTCERYEVDPPTTEEMDEFITDIGGEVTFDLFALVTIPHILAQAAGIDIIQDIEIVVVD